MKTIRYFLFLSALCAVSAVVVACGSDTTTGDGSPASPRGVLAANWGTTPTDPDNLTKRENMPRATFMHDDHDDRTCVSCHTSNAGGKINITTKEGNTPKDKIHGFCSAQCHSTMKANEAPVYDTTKLENCYECHKVTSKIDLKARWGLTAGTEDNVTFKHGDHDDADKNMSCVSCHVNINTDKNDKTVEVGMPITRDTAHTFCNDCHLMKGKDVPKITECAKCHKATTAGGGSGTAPKYDIYLKPRWNPTSTSSSMSSKFEHSEHRRSDNGTAINCTDCHTSATGGTIDIDSKPSPNVNGTIMDKAHNLCSTCHILNKKAPQVANGRDCEDCHDD